jgi:hypothetical protein
LIFERLTKICGVIPVQVKIGEEEQTDTSSEHLPALLFASPAELNVYRGEKYFVGEL